MPEGPPAGVRYGLCTAAGEPTARARAAAAVARVVHATPTLATAQLVAPYVAIVLSRRTALIAFTSERQIDLYTTAVRGAHRLFFDADIPTQFLHERDIGQQGVPGEIKAVYWPLPSVASPKLAAQLTAFTHRGGTLVAEAGPAQYDPLGWFQPVQPGAGLDALFGAHIIETDVVGRIELTSGSGRIKGEWQLDRLQPHDAEVIATGPDGTPAAVHNRFGKGSAILIGTHPSLAYEKARDTSTRAAILRLIPRDAPLLRWDEPMPGRYHRRLSSPDLDLVVAINETLEPARFALSDGYRVQALRAVTQAARPSTVAPQAAALIEIAVGQSPD